MKKHLDAREASLMALTSVIEEGAFVNLALAKVLTNHTMDVRDRRLAAEITYGVITYRLTLDWLIQQITGRPAEKLDRPVMHVLYIGLYQLFYLDRVPAPAAVHSTVELVKKTKKRALASFVNGVLRGALRKKDILNWPDRAQNEAEYLSIKYAHPLWIVNRWLTRMSGSEVEKLLVANNQAPPVTVRVNTLRTTREKLLHNLAENNIEAVTSDIVPEGIILKDSGSLSQLTAYQQGFFQVQSESAMLVSRVLNPAAESFVLDMCSAPGGKTTHLAALMENRGNIIALDIYKHRLELVKANARRLGTDIIQTKLMDAQELQSDHFGTFDHILLDVPCSGLGVIHRKPDIKERRKIEDIAVLARIQKNMLTTAAAVLKPGGTVVYAACTNEPEETNELIAAFLIEQPQFISLDFSSHLPAAWAEDMTAYGIQLYTHKHGIDGFFISKLQKNC